MATKAKKEEEVKEEEVKATEETEETKEEQQEEKNEVAAVENRVEVNGPQEAEYDEDDYSNLGFDNLDELTGLDDVDASKIRVPYAKLYRKPAPGFKPGDIELVDGTVIHGADDEVLENLCILMKQSVRVYFPEKYNKNNSFICRSFDGKVGAPDGEYAGTKCSECKFSKYPEGGGSSPCRAQELLLCTLPGGDMFYLLVSGISVKPFYEIFVSNEMMKGLRKAKRKIGIQTLGALNIRASVEMEDTDNGQFPKMIFRVDRENPTVSRSRLIDNLEMLDNYKVFEREAIATAADFAHGEQPETEDANQEPGQNDAMF